MRTEVRELMENGPVPEKLLQKNPTELITSPPSVYS